VQECFRIVDKISSSLEQGKYFGGVFLDVAQAFDQVWLVVHAQKNPT
jgi:hypothetical protein